MSDEDQSTKSTTTDNTSASADSSSDASMDGIDSDLKIPSLDNLEYATPSAYIDPDLPANPAPIRGPGEPGDDTPETPEEEPEEAPKEDTELKEVPEDGSKKKSAKSDPNKFKKIAKGFSAIMSTVAEKITDSRNILIAVSNTPTVDDLTTAIALSLFLGRLGKHAVAIYSGAIPVALKFLNPSDNFERNTDAFQDFVISIDRNKADHLRYKLEGEYVRIFVTPYKDRISADDLEFSYGDFNVDLILALNVSDHTNLDDVIRNHGTISNDIAIINISTGAPSKFGKIQWSSKTASSISEMVAELLLSAGGDIQINSREATALLTGIVAATDRFAKANTSPNTLEIASRLMDAGADQQLVASNLSNNIQNQFTAFPGNAVAPSANGSNFAFGPNTEDNASLVVTHMGTNDGGAYAGAGMSENMPENPQIPGQPTMPSETVIAPPATTTPARYGQMFEQAIASPTAPTMSPMENSLPPVVPPMDNTLPPAMPQMEGALPPVSNQPNQPVPNPAVASAPNVSVTPDVSNMPDINYGQTTGDQLLPPPPVPPVDVNATMPIPTQAELPPTPNIPTSPAPAPSPDTFSIPNV